jgi:hypothetical protein
VVSVEQRGRTLRVNRALRTKTGIDYFNLKPRYRDKTDEAATKPKVDVFLKEMGAKPIAGGQLEYG